MSDDTTRVFITGGTGYIGRRLIPVLLRQGCTVTALVRPGSESKLPHGCRIAVGSGGRSGCAHARGGSGGRGHALSLRRDLSPDIRSCR